MSIIAYTLSKVNPKLQIPHREHKQNWHHEIGDNCRSVIPVVTMAGLSHAATARRRYPKISHGEFLTLNFLRMRHVSSARV